MPTANANPNVTQAVTRQLIELYPLLISNSILIRYKQNRTLEAKIDSPVRENRCTIPDTIVNHKAINYGTKNHKQRTATTTNAKVDVVNKEMIEKRTIEEKNYTKQQEQERKYEEQRKDKTPTSNKKKEKKEEETRMTTRTTSREKVNKEIGIITMAFNVQTDGRQNKESSGTNETNNRSNSKDRNADENTDKNNMNRTNKRDKSNKNNSNGNNDKTRVNITTPGEMTTYTFTISWRPEQKVGQDGKIIIKMLMREMVHRTPQIIFHPTNAASSPVPRDINNINNDFPTTPASFDDIFDQMRNRENKNQRTCMKVTTMPHDEKELQRKLGNYLFFHNKLYMNSPFIDDNTLEQVGFIKNGHSRLVYRPNLEMKIRQGLQGVMEGELLTPQQTAQLKHLSSPIRVECHRGIVRAGPIQQQVVCEGIILKTAKLQSKIAMELLSMLPETLLGDHYRIIPKSLGNLLGYELYGRIVADTVNLQNKLRPITIIHCHPSVFEDQYDSVKVQNSSHVKVNKSIIECCGAISIEETNETKEKGKHI
jgi:hypothetical protein